MNSEALKRKAYQIWYILGLIVLMFIVCYVLSFLKHVVILLTIAILIAYVLTPLVRFFNNPIIINIKDYIKIYSFQINVPLKKKTIVIHKKGFPVVISIIFVYLFLLIVFVLFILYILPMISTQFKSLLNNRHVYMNGAMEFYEKANEWITPRIPESAKQYIPSLTAKVIDEARNFSVSMLHQSVPIMKSIASYIALIFIIPFVTFYILMDVDKYRSAFMAIIPERRREEFSNLLHEIDLMLGRYIRGQIIVCVVIGVSVTIALLMLDIPYAVLIGVFAGVIDVIPYVGVAIGMIPAVILALFKSPFYALFVLFILYLIHWTEGHIIVPNVMGQSIGLPPLVIIIALIIGMETLGILGMFLAVPIASVIRVIVSHYLNRLSAAGEEVRV